VERNLEEIVEGLNRAQLAQLVGLAMARLATPEPASTVRVEDRLLTVKEAALKLGTTPSSLYASADTYPFTVRQSAGRLRFSLNGIERYIEQQQGRRPA
jgi:predicted DNA-binding transcriptional regulator AlpA